MEDECVCSFCLDFFEEPCILDCSHNYCRKCIRILAGSSSPRFSIVCPLCRQTTHVTPEHPLKLNLSLRNIVQHVQARQNARSQQRKQEVVEGGPKMHRILVKFAPKYCEFFTSANNLLAKIMEETGTKIELVSNSDQQQQQDVLGNDAPNVQLQHSSVQLEAEGPSSVNVEIQQSPPPPLQVSPEKASLQVSPASPSSPALSPTLSPASSSPALSPTLSSPAPSPPTGLVIYGDHDSLSLAHTRIRHAMQAFKESKKIKHIVHVDRELHGEVIGINEVRLNEIQRATRTRIQFPEKGTAVLIIGKNQTQIALAEELLKGAEQEVAQKKAAEKESAETKKRLRMMEIEEEIRMEERERAKNNDCLIS